MAKRALLIGINRYRNAAVGLRGCLNDLEALQSVLTDRCGFTGADIQKATDFRATKDRIESAIAKLAAQARPGDVLLVHFSGCGSSVGEEEIVCPTDGIDWSRPLWVSRLREILAGTPEGVHTAMTLDCCYSGTHTRYLLPPDAARLPRFLPSPAGSAAAGAPGGSSRHGTPPSVLASDVPGLLLRACQEQEVAVDVKIGDGHYGAFTYCLVESLRAAGSDLTYRELHARTTKLLARLHFPQRPRLEAPAADLDRPVLQPFE